MWEPTWLVSCSSGPGPGPRPDQLNPNLSVRGQRAARVGNHCPRGLVRSVVGRDREEGITSRDGEGLRSPATHGILGSSAGIVLALTESCRGDSWITLCWILDSKRIKNQVPHHEIVLWEGARFPFPNSGLEVWRAAAFMSEKWPEIFTLSNKTGAFLNYFRGLWEQWNRILAIRLPQKHRTWHSRKGDWPAHVLFNARVYKLCWTSELSGDLI